MNLTWGKIDMGNCQAKLNTKNWKIKKRLLNDSPKIAEILLFFCIFIHNQFLSERALPLVTIRSFDVTFQETPIVAVV